MRLRSLVVLAAGVVSTVSLLAVPGSASPPPTGLASADQFAVPHKLTLITGDVVTYAGSGANLHIVSTRQGDGRHEVGLLQLAEHGERYVIPTDAWRGVAQGVIDKRLFDITALVAQGMNDERRTAMRVIVTGPNALSSRLRVPHSAKIISRLATIHAQTVSAVPSARGSLWRAVQQSHVLGGSARTRTAIWLDGRVHATLDESVPLIGAPTAWSHGYRGSGVKVAVLDTGIDTEHPDLVGKVTASANFSSAPDDQDHLGHGTHVASTITGSGAASGGRYKGVAPGVRLLNGKVLGDDGYGDDSAVLAGMDWAVAQGAKIVNMSLGDQPSDGTDPVSEEINALTATFGTLFVVAAGNSGPAGAVGSPASADAALAVASTTKQDALSYFSSRGPRVGDAGLKPEIAAPGSNIVAARAPGTLQGNAVDRFYAQLSGTSMATPHVTGAAAILAGRHPSWKASELKAALMSTSKVLAGLGVFDIGAGRVDIARAIEQPVRATTASVSLNTVVRQSGSPVASRVVTYANDSAGPITLHVTLHVDDASGSAAPPSLLTLSTTTITVPAHGSASLAVRLSGSGTARGTLSGRVLAVAAGGVSVVVPVAVRLVSPSRTLQVSLIDRHGDAASAEHVFAVVQNENTGDLEFVGMGASGDLEAAIPAGDYRIAGVVYGFGRTDTPTESTLFVQGGIQVLRDATVSVDLRGAGRMHATVDDPQVSESRFEHGNVLDSAVSGSDGTSEINVSGANTDTYVYAPQTLAGVTAAYVGAFTRERVSVSTAAYSVGVVTDLSASGWRGDITAPLVDIGLQTDPDALPDVRGKVVLFAADVQSGSSFGPPPDGDAVATLLQALRDRGALLVLTDGSIFDLSVMPVLDLFDGNDVQGLRDSIEAGSSVVHLVGRPASPTAYFLFDTFRGSLTGGHTWSFHRSQLARIDANYRSAAMPTRFASTVVVVDDPATGLGTGIEHEVQLPQRRTEYYSAGPRWLTQLAIGLVRPDEPEPADEISIPTTYRSGQRLTAEWGSAPYGPSLSNGPVSRQDGQPTPAVYRQGNRLAVNVQAMNSNDPSHVIVATNWDDGTTALYRGDQLICDNDVPGVAGCTLPASSQRYRLEVDAARHNDAWPTSTHVHASWQFTSAATSPMVRTPVGLLDLRFDLGLDSFNLAVAGRALRGSVVAGHQAGTTQTQIAGMTLSVSYDDGTTWRSARVRSLGGGHFTVAIPGGGTHGGYVSVRASAWDTAGNSITETIDRAYALR